MRKIAAFAAAALSAFLLAPPAARAAHDQLIIGMAQFPSTLHPDIDAEVVKAYVAQFAVRQITAFDPGWKNSCLLCAELPTIENGLAKVEDRADGKKGMAVTIRLKAGLKWGDGVPVTTKDLMFTWKLAQDPKTGFSNGNPWSRADKIDIADDQTAVLHLDEVLASYNQWDEILPEHIEGPIYEKAKDAGAYVHETAYARAPTTAGLYDGPFIVTGYASGAQIVLEPNLYWPGPKPGLKRIVLKLIGNTAALEANLLSGDVDMVVGEGVGLTIDQAIDLKKQHPDQFSYDFKPSLTYEHIDLKKENPLLSDLRVRQALVYAADRKTLVDKLFAGLQPVATTWVNPLSPYYSKDVQTYPYDPARAKALLADDGWKPGPDGICRNANGDRLSLEFSTTSGNRLRELQQQVLQSNWKAACIEVTIKNTPARTFFGETVKKREYDGLAMYAWSTTPTQSPRRTLGSEEIPTEANGWGGANYIGYANSEMDNLIDQAEQELDPGKQKAIWARMQEIYAKDLPVVPLFYRAEPHVYPKWLRGYTPTGTGDMSPSWAENWSSE
jgi:peptide/nickel transport system substrate-binding protein